MVEEYQKVDASPAVLDGIGWPEAGRVPVGIIAARSMERLRALLSFALAFLSFGMVGRALEAERFEAGGGGSAASVGCSKKLH